MRRIAYLFLITILSFTISGCATPMLVGLKKGPQQYIPSGDPNKGYIYIYREREYFGCLRGIYVTANGTRIGGVNSGSYFVYEADPGEVTMSVENWLEKDPTIKINVEPGKKYYLKTNMTLGLWEPSPWIARIHESEGEKAIKKLAYATLIR